MEKNVLPSGTLAMLLWVALGSASIFLRVDTGSAEIVHGASLPTSVSSAGPTAVAARLTGTRGGEARTSRTSPEPAMIFLFGSGLAGLMLLRWRP